MNKNTANSQQFLGRVGNASTKPSARGINLLGWGEPEVLSTEQQREALLAAVKGLQEQAKSATKAEKKEIGARIYDLNMQICALKAVKTYDGRELGSFILDVVKENVPRLTWERYVKEATQRYRDAQPPEQEAA